MDIPAAQRDSALQLKIKQWTPFAEAANYTVWKGGQAQVWVWDKSRQQALLSEIGIKNATVIPEPLLYARPVTDEVRLLQCLEGVEGQIWHDGLLIGCRWWSSAPSAIEWAYFQRAHGLAATQEVPPTLELQYLERPWGRSKADFTFFNLRRESLWVTLGAAFFTVLLTWQMVGLWKWQRATTQVQTKIETLQTKISSILELRNRAIADKLVIDELFALAPYPHQIDLMAIVTDILLKINQELKLPANDIRLIDWLYQMGELKMTIESSEIDPTVYVKTFQDHPRFTEVKSSTGRKSEQIILTMKVNTGASMTN